MTAVRRMVCNATFNCLLHNMGEMVLSIPREVGCGRVPCQPGQVRKEAAAVSFARVIRSASHLPFFMVYIGIV